MTARILTLSGLGLWLGLAGPSPVCAEDLPRLGCVVYGKVRNAFGRLVMPEDRIAVSVQRNRVELTYGVVGAPIGQAANFRVPINVVKVLTPGAVPERGTAADGERLQLRFRSLGGATVAAIGTETLEVRSGQVIPRDFVLGTDDDHDGLPDEWERFILAAAGNPDLTDIAALRPEDDLDGDGASNQDEFCAGTFPFLDSDSLRMEAPELLPGRGLRFTLLTTAGLTYSVLGATNVAGMEWTVLPVGVSPTASPSVQHLSGTGDYQTVYVSTNGLSDFFRVVAR